MNRVLIIRIISYLMNLLVKVSHQNLTWIGTNSWKRMWRHQLTFLIKGIHRNAVFHVMLIAFGVFYIRYTLCLFYIIPLEAFHLLFYHVNRYTYTHFCVAKQTLSRWTGKTSSCILLESIHAHSALCFLPSEEVGRNDAVCVHLSSAWVLSELDTTLSDRILAEFAEATGAPRTWMSSQP
jgi:hypothetical protein